MVDAATLEKLEAGFQKLQAATDCKSLLKKYLTKEVFDSLKTKKTSFGSTLLDVIQSGVENLDSGVGVYAPDAEAYTLFADLFDPIIEDYHAGFKKTDKHPNKDFGDVNSVGNVDPEGQFVISTRVRCGRSMEGYPFNPCLTEAQYKEMEEKVSSTLSGLEGELKGTFYPLTGMAKDVQQKLIDDHFLFKEGDRFLQAANACRFWPTGRGIYHNNDKTFLVWCNEEDHLRIISMQMGGDLGQVYRRLVNAATDIEKRIPFSHHGRLGFLTFCPTNLGTTIRASVHIKLPKLAADKKKLEEVAAKYSLQVRGTRGEHTEAEGGIYDISNKRRMGLTEYEAVKEMHDGILELIKIEKSL
ncbi:arginine kinase Scy p 2.0101 [Amphibalanus amphitrite]|uniref:arginine kinase Scy p 2.0101 n=1 Tax=Amphibalanus amphitrite TaxID=1232801 RepID=UPI001C906E81|nr:arginine kinase Scy p 2.0101 [Amphibalanus amphitrite]XP_043241033.1 arginine kinase Scy p 2.0101 [Amphibalanus amphitrite]XP_043241034.1 arginine kinase Scy p 2.0101 [Amphibalanus amphitrite]